AGVALGAVFALLAGLRVHRPLQREPWLLIACAAGVIAGGAAVRAVYVVRGGPGLPFSVRDLAAVVAYPILGLGLFVLAGRRTARRDWAGIIDATLITVGAAVATWVFVVPPIWDRNPQLTTAHAISLAHP